MLTLFVSLFSGGLDDALNNILNYCQEQNVPFVFALGRRALGRACAKLVPVSVCGIFNYEGCEVKTLRSFDLTENALNVLMLLLLFNFLLGNIPQTVRPYWKSSQCFKKYVSINRKHSTNCLTFLKTLSVGFEKTH